MGDRSHPQLRALDNLKRAGLTTYTGWEADVRKAEKYHVEYPNLFDCFLGEIRKKQKIHLGDRSHPQLQALDNLKRAGLNYTGWEADVRKAEKYHVEYPNLFDGFVGKMQRKQTIHLPQRPRESDCNVKEPERKKARRSDDKEDNLSDVQESEECVVCLSSKRTHAFVPCGHMCVCNKCADSIKNRMCPICRMVSKQIIKIFQ